MARTISDKEMRALLSGDTTDQEISEVVELNPIPLGEQQSLPLEQAA